MNELFKRISENGMDAFRKAKTHKYYKRLPKKTGKGWIYYYTRAQWVNRDKKTGEPKAVQGPREILDALMSFFGLSKQKVDQKLTQDYNTNNIGSTYGVEKFDFIQHVKEYVLNKAVWDKKLSVKKKVEPKEPKEKKERKPSEPKKGGEKEKWNIDLMRKIAGLYGSGKGDKIEPPKKVTEPKPVGPGKGPGGDKGGKKKKEGPSEFDRQLEKEKKKLENEMKVKTIDKPSPMAAGKYEVTHPELGTTYNVKTEKDVKELKTKLALQIIEGRKREAESVSGPIELTKQQVKKLEKLEDENEHSKYVVEMAKISGNKEWIAEATEIYKKHEKDGHLTNENSDRRITVSKKIREVVKFPGMKEKEKPIRKKGLAESVKHLNKIAPFIQKVGDKNYERVTNDYYISIMGEKGKPEHKKVNGTPVSIPEISGHDFFIHKLSGWAVLAEANSGARITDAEMHDLPKGDIKALKEAFESGDRKTITRLQGYIDRIKGIGIGKAIDEYGLSPRYKETNVTRAKELEALENVRQGVAADVKAQSEAKATGKRKAVMTSGPAGEATSKYKKDDHPVLHNALSKTVGDVGTVNGWKFKAGQVLDNGQVYVGKKKDFFTKKPSDKVFHGDAPVVYDPTTKEVLETMGSNMKYMDKNPMAIGTTSEASVKKFLKDEFSARYAAMDDKWITTTQLFLPRSESNLDIKEKDVQGEGSKMPNVEVIINSITPKMKTMKEASFSHTKVGKDNMINFESGDETVLIGPEPLKMAIRLATGEKEVDLNKVKIHYDTSLNPVLISYGDKLKKEDMVVIMPMRKA